MFGSHYCKCLLFVSAMFRNLSHSSWCAAVFCHTVNCKTTQHQQNDRSQSSHVSKEISTYQIPQMHMHLSSTQHNHTYNHKKPRQLIEMRQHHLKKSDDLPKSQCCFLAGLSVLCFKHACQEAAMRLRQTRRCKCDRFIKLLNLALP